MRKAFSLFDSNVVDPDPIICVRKDTDQVNIETNVLIQKYHNKNKFFQ